MLGGLSYVHENDVRNSTKLLKKFKLNYPLKFKRCLDLGCGIGRVSFQLLANFFEEIDLVEQSDDFLKKAQAVLS